MAITMTATQGTDKWADFEDGVYELILHDMEEDEGKFGPQYKVYFRAADLTDPETGDPATLTTWVSQKFNITPGKESNLALMVRALLGRDPAEGEEISDAALRDKRCMATVTLSERGWPRIKNDSFARIRQAKPAAKPLPPPPAPKPVLDPTLQAQLIKAAQDADFDPTGKEFTDWLVQSFGHALDALTTDEANAAIESLSAGF